jgi:hypothetical protein
MCPDVLYPQATPPTENKSVYPATDEPSEDFFDLEDPLEQLRERGPLLEEELPSMPLPLPPQ